MNLRIRKSYLIPHDVALHTSFETLQATVSGLSDRIAHLKSDIESRFGPLESQSYLESFPEQRDDKGVTPAGKSGPEEVSSKGFASEPRPEGVSSKKSVWGRVHAIIMDETEDRDLRCREELTQAARLFFSILLHIRTSWKPYLMLFTCILLGKFNLIEKDELPIGDLIPETKFRLWRLFSVTGFWCAISLSRPDEANTSSTHLWPIATNAVPPGPGRVYPTLGFHCRRTGPGWICSKFNGRQCFAITGRKPVTTFVRCTGTFENGCSSNQVTVCVRVQVASTYLSVWA